ncbi:MAG: TatD family hydrolase [Bacterioplanes sp.]|nr:TatD family hydrolase [Bacterioplanes sp.]
MTVSEHAPLRWFDSHCHWDFSSLDSERETQWLLAQRLGVCGYLIPGISREQGQRQLDHDATKQHGIALGLHPYFLAQHRPSDLAWLHEQCQRHDLVALGEFGLDWVLATTSEQQRQQWDWFEQQLDIAETHQLPIILHVRKAHDQVAAALRRRQFAYGGVVHAFSGSVQQGKAYLDLGMTLGIGGAMSHPRAHKLRRTVAALPNHAWLLETDSPDMTPAFWQGPRNSLATIPLLAAILASLQQQSLAAVAEQQWSNCARALPKWYSTLV